MRISLFITAALVILTLAASDLYSAPQTTKTLEEVEPRTPIHAVDLPLTISVAGSYYLTENMTMTDPAKQNGIIVNASDVTIDLNGFVLGGNTRAGSINHGHGILAKAPVTNLTIRNGTIAQWEKIGVYLLGVNGFRLENVSLNTNGEEGIQALNTSGGQLEEVSAMFNVRSGILLISGGRVHACTAGYNGIAGIAISDSIVTACDVFYNLHTGIYAGGKSSVTGCVSRNNSVGIHAGQPTDVVISENVVAQNESTGIESFGHGIVTNNICRENEWFGIWARGNGRITGNSCDKNDKAGYFFDKEALHHIANNTATDNDVGFKLLGAEALLIKNTASGNTPNYLISGNSTFGPLISMVGGGVIATINPWANFSW